MHTLLNVIFLLYTPEHEMYFFVFFYMSGEYSEEMQTVLHKLLSHLQVVLVPSCSTYKVLVLLRFSVFSGLVITQATGDIHHLFYVHLVLSL